MNKILSENDACDLWAKEAQRTFNRQCSLVAEMSNYSNYYPKPKPKRFRMLRRFKYWVSGLRITHIDNIRNEYE